MEETILAWASLEIFLWAFLFNLLEGNSSGYPRIEIGLEGVLDCHTEILCSMEYDIEIPRLRIEKMLVVAEFLQPSSHSVLTDLTYLILEEILDASKNDAILGAAIICFEDLELFLTYRFACDSVKLLKL